MTVLLAAEEVEMRSDVREGSGLKYPAVKVQDEVVKAGEERVWRMERMAGSSVEVSGLRRGVSWETG